MGNYHKINLECNKKNFNFCVPYDIYNILQIESKKQEVPINHILISSIIKDFGKFYDFSDIKKIHEEIRLFNISKKGWEITGFIEKMIDRIHEYIQRHEAKNREIDYKALQIQIKKDLAVAYVRLPFEIIESNYKIIHAFSECSNDIIKLKNYCNYLRSREPNRFIKQKAEFDEEMRD